MEGKERVGGVVNAAIATRNQAHERESESKVNSGEPFREMGDRKKKESYNRDWTAVVVSQVTEYSKYLSRMHSV